MPHPKLEGLLRVTTAWTMTVTEVGGGTATVTIAPADDYFHNSTAPDGGGLLGSIKYQLDNNATLQGTYTLSIDDNGNTSTGKLTISATGITSFSFSFPAGNPAPATVLGLAAQPSGTSLSYTGEGHVQYLFLPSCGRVEALSPDGDDGDEECDFTMTVAPDGSTKRLALSTKRYVDNLQFDYLLGNKTWKSLETTTNESMQRFWEQVISAGYPFRYHADRSVNNVYNTWVAENGGRFGAKPRLPMRWGASALFTWGSPVRKLV